MDAQLVRDYKEGHWLVMPIHYFHTTAGFEREFRRAQERAR